jgi:L-rhamnose mutarotase
MQRVAFRLRLKPDAIEEYENAHAQVWPELLAKLKEVGISDYSIFRHGQDLFLCMRVADFDSAWAALDKDPVNQRWQKEMSRSFEPVANGHSTERFAMMKEVFYME